MTLAAGAAAIAFALVLAASAQAQEIQGQAQGEIQGEQQPAASLPIEVFEPAPAPAGATGLKHSRGDYPVSVRFDQLDLARPGDTVRVVVAEGATVDLVVGELRRRDEDSYSLEGSVRSAAGSNFILVREGDALAGDIRIPTANLHFKLKHAGLNAAGQTVHLVCNIDDSLWAECGGAAPVPPDAPGRDFDPIPESWEGQIGALPPGGDEPGGYGARGSCSNVQPVFDVMVVYTNLARAAAGGTDAIHAEIQLGVDTANLTYNNSNVNARYRLVWRGEITYNESGALTDHRDRLRDPGDGFYDQINVTRDSVNADMCSIWVDDDDNGQWCGFAFCETTAEAAYICVNWECAAGNFSYPHEHGHGQGCAHNPEDAGSCPLYTYSYGNRWSSGGSSYRTVMAYNTTNGPYQRIGYWSNPDVDYLGVATGTATRDNARTLDTTARTVEGFEFGGFDVWVDEDPPTPIVQIGTYAFPFDTITEGVNLIDVPSPGASERPTLHVVTGTYGPFIGTISKTMNIIPCGGTVTIGN
jgi:hypothetical protein